MQIYQYNVLSLIIINLIFLFPTDNQAGLLNTRRGRKLLQEISSQNIREVSRILENHPIDLDQTYKYNKQMYYPLLMAVNSGQVEIVDELLAYKPNLEVQCDTHDTALNLAVANGYSEIVDLLIKHGAKLETANNIGNTPWLTAISEKQFELAIKLFKLKINIYAKDNDGRNCFDMAYKVSPKNYPLFEMLIDGGVDPNLPIIVDGKKSTLLFEAIKNNDQQLLDILLKSEHINLDLPDNLGRTPLILAIAYGDDDLSFKKLLGKGANHEGRSFSGTTPLMVSISSKKFEITKKLLELGSSVHTTNKKKHNALELAMLKDADNFELFELLVQKGAYSFQILRDLVKKGDLTRVKILLKGHHYDLTKTSKEDGNTLINLAVRHGHTDIVKLLLKLKSHLEIFNSHGDTPLLTAIKQNNKQLVMLLLEARPQVNVKNNAGDTPLSLAIKNNMDVELVAALLKEGADYFIRIRDSDNNMLHEAIMARKTQLAKLIIASEEFDPNGSQGENGQSYLHLAALNGDVEICNMLISRGAHLDFLDELGESPLMKAIINQQGEIVSLLLENGALKVFTNYQGVDLRAKFQYLETEWALEEHRLREDQGSEDELSQELEKLGIIFLDTISDYENPQKIKNFNQLLKVLCSQTDKKKIKGELFKILAFWQVISKKPLLYGDLETVLNSLQIDPDFLTEELKTIDFADLFRRECDGSDHFKKILSNLSSEENCDEVMDFIIFFDNRNSARSSAWHDELGYKLFKFSQIIDSIPLERMTKDVLPAVVHAGSECPDAKKDCVEHLFFSYCPTDHQRIN